MKIVKQDENNDLYQELTDNIIWREKLIWNKTFRIIYEYLKTNAEGLEEYAYRPISIEFSRENNLPSEFYSMYQLTQNGIESSCIVLNWKDNTVKYLPIKQISILNAIGKGLKPSEEIMNFSMEVPQNGDRTKTWCFTKQIVNCIGAFEEVYKPLKKRIEVIFCPIKEYAEIITQEYPTTKKTPWSETQHRDITSHDEQFVSFPIRIENALDECTYITVTGENGSYMVSVQYADGGKEQELIKADSLYNAYLQYMNKHNYFDTFASKVKRQKV